MITFDILAAQAASHSAMQRKAEDGAPAAEAAAVRRPATQGAPGQRARLRLGHLWASFGLHHATPRAG